RREDGGTERRPLGRRSRERPFSNLPVLSDELEVLYAPNRGAMAGQSPVAPACFEARAQCAEAPLAMRSQSAPRPAELRVSLPLNSPVSVSCMRCDRCRTGRVAPNVQATHAGAVLLERRGPTRFARNHRISLAEIAPDSPPR